MIRRLLAWGLVLWCVTAALSAQSASRYAGRLLADVLRDLQSRGLNVVFSSELVRADMRVASEPKATAPRRILDEVLEPHRLRVTPGANGALLVVPMPRKSSAPTLTPVANSGGIKGQVIDKRTGVALPGVTVTVQGTTITTVTAEEGRFELIGVPPGPQSLFVSLVGYGLARPTADVTTGKTVEITIALADGVGSYADAVTVVADQFRGAEPSVPAQQTLTNADMLDLRGVITDDPMRAVQALPGVATGDDFRSEFSVRASDFRHIGLSFDGVPMGWLVHLTRGTQDTGSVSIVNGDVIERATLLAGPYPQRAPGRTGAWLNVDLQEGSRSHTQGHLTVSGTATAVSIDGPIGRRPRGSWLVSARQSYLQWILHKLDPSGGEAFGFSDVAGKFVYDLAPRHQLRFSLLGGRSQFDDNEVNPSANTVHLAINRTGVATLSWHWTLPRAQVVQRAAVLGSDFTNTGALQQANGEGTESSRWYVLDARIDAGHGAALTVGGGLQRSGMNYVDRRYVFGANTSTVLLASSSTTVQSAVTGVAHAGVGFQRASGALLDAGVSLARNSEVAGTPVSSWVLVAKPIGHGGTIRAGASVAQQFPDLAQIARFTPATSIRPEHSINVDTGLEFRLSPSVRWQLTLYQRSERDVLRLDQSEYRLVGGTLLSPSSNQLWHPSLRGTSRGIELMVQRRALTRVSGWLSYSYGHARYTDDDSGETFWADFDQRHALNAYGLVRFSPKTSLSGKIRLGSNFPLGGYFSHVGNTLFVGRERNAERLPAYQRIDLRLNHAFTFTKRRLTLFAEVLNVLGHDNYGPSSGFVRNDGAAFGFTNKLMPFLPSLGFVFDF